MIRGFTLLEILVVLVLIGIVSTFTLLSVRLGGETRMLDEALHRVDRLVVLAQDETRYRMVDLGLEFAADGYRFVSWDGVAWSALPDPGPFRQRPWPPAVAARLVVDGMPAELPGALPDDRIDPQVMILSSGEVTPFELHLEADSGHAGRLTVRLTGETERAAAAAPAR